MIRIQVQSDGSVTGDVGRIIAYENRTYSEPIQILHPCYKDAIYKVIYRWGHTQFEDFLDSNDQVSVHVHGAGIVKMQFVAQNPITGVNYLVSKTFELIVHKNLDMGPNAFVSSHIIPCCPPPSVCGGVNGNNELEVLMKLGIELAEEQRVRASQDSVIWEEIFKIKQALEDKLGIVIDDKEPELKDCDLLVDPGEYNLAVGSLNTPIDGKPFKVQVKRYNAQVLQTAYLTSEEETRIYYRTGTVITEATETAPASTQFVSWVPMIHEGEVKVVEY